MNEWADQPFLHKLYFSGGQTLEMCQHSVNMVNLHTLFPSCTN